ncbi:hypothetical protein IMG5_190360 [Ichthyophthirius multifiliis]|uniref:Uncharacterized protein n=1 Tax=Ichthyophthirius multifiliis TaxID=5932 RepID=G0R470_ICHMU|nr:hypothetical protein IMG5_190360 [Ichthyophthirius multifiliis]EGR27741.1 hypothetical protein IMG5_190360 [Ichthyophthirius multifiliis]|eukprot:XP_004025193.1 hypothetical protein IMG5_190360 [Ichthyophthirius multifiliis]
MNETPKNKEIPKQRENNILIDKLKAIQSGDSFKYKKGIVTSKSRFTSCVIKSGGLDYKQIIQENTPSFQHQQQFQASTFEQLQGYKELKWEFRDQHDQETPHINLQIYADEFASSTFQMILWANQNPEIEQTIKDQSHGYVQMIKFLSEDVGIKIEQEQFIICEININKSKLWNQGCQVGIWKGEFIVSHQPFLKQLIAGVRTEEGIVKASSLYIKKQNLNQKTTLPREVNYYLFFDFIFSFIFFKFKNLMNKKIALEESVFKLYDTNLTYRDRQNINNDIRMHLSRIIECLHIHTLQGSQYLYSNEEELIRVQDLLINLAQHLLEYADQVDESLRELYYEALILINNREELDLSYIGFQQEQMEQYIKSGKTLPNVKNLEVQAIEKQPLLKKIKICLTYESYLIETLENVLIKLDQKGGNEKERQFIENFCALAFFRIPQFKKKFLECLENEQGKEKNPQIDEWFDNISSINLNGKTSFLASLFSWEQNYYQYLESQTKHKEHQDKLIQVLENKNWQKRIYKAGVAYFSFLAEWCRYINKQFANKDQILWYIIPGYYNLVKVFLIKMRKIETKLFPENLKDTSLILLYNEQNLNIYITIMYNKTNAYDGINVFYSFDLIKQWFQTIKENGKKIPTNFDYDFFFKGIKITLQGENFVCISKVLQLLYYCYELLPWLQKRQLQKIIFTNMFFKLFMHWSRNVRYLFHCFLIYKIYHIHHTYRGNNKLLRQNTYSSKKKYQQNKTYQQKIKQNEYIYEDYQRMIAILEEAKRRIIKFQKQNEIQKLIMQKPKISKLKLIHKKRKQQKLKQSFLQAESLEDNNQLLESLNLSIISRQQSIASLNYVNKMESQMQASNKEINLDQIQKEENNFLNQSESDIKSISSIESILNEINDNLDEKEQNKKKNIVKKRQKQRRKSEFFKKEINIKSIRKIHVPGQNQNNKGIKIYRRYKDENEGQEKLRIPKSCLKYLIESWEDFDEIRKKYNQWIGEWLDIYQKDENLNDDEIIQKIINLNTPDMHVTVPQDESDFQNEFKINFDNEW